MISRASAVIAGLLPLACAVAGDDDIAEKPSDAVVIVDTGGDTDIDMANARVQGSGVCTVTRTGETLSIRVDPVRTGGVEVQAPGACPLRISPAALAPRRVVRERLTPLFSVGGPLPQVGFGQTFSVTLAPNCPEAPKAVTWDQEDGPVLGDVHVGALTFAARMPEAANMLGHDPAWGIVPISARSQARVNLVATWKAVSGENDHRVIPVSAAARARGLPNVTLGTRLYLGGSGWRVSSRPPGSRTEVENLPEPKGKGLPSFMPDARGTFVLEDGDQHRLRLVAGKYDETPLDCGRSECHRSIAETSRSSPMQTIFARGIGTRFAENYPACALGCHTAGEPGIDDGGFAAIAALLGRSPQSLSQDGYHDMPPALRRVSGVNCLACHGPGTVPEQEGRWALLRADVCATCHDAPPRYGHVAAFQTSGMARADVDPRTRGDACARCHTTWGFLGQPERRPPAHAGPTGIGCAACHAVHPEHKDTTVGRVCAAALPRDVAVPAMLEGRIPSTASKSRVCLPCHTPDGEGGAAASSAAIWLGRGGLEPATGAPIEGESGETPHAAVEGGCIGCHRGGPDGLGKGASHEFRADETACAGCHAPKTDDEAGLALARDLFVRLGGSATVPSGSGSATREPAHATPRRIDLASPRGRALHDVLLVLEDRGALAHNAPYVRRLLAAAERATEAAGERSRQRAAGARAP